jgi:hypothetical protein
MSQAKPVRRCEELEPMDEEIETWGCEVGRRGRGEKREGTNMEEPVLSERKPP